MGFHAFHGDWSERRKWQNPEEILAEIGLKAGFTFADVGCGDGFFSIPAARTVGTNGHVYALDIDSDAMNELVERANLEKLQNISATVGAAEDAILCQKCADIVFFSLVLHDFNDPAKVLSNARHMLKTNGKLVDVDWEKKPMSIGPPLSIRFSREHAQRLIENAGLGIVETRTCGKYHYMVIAKPQTPWR